MSAAPDHLAQQLLHGIQQFEGLVEWAQQALRSHFGASGTLPEALASGQIPGRGCLKVEGHELSFAFRSGGCRVEMDEHLLDFDFGTDGLAYAGFDVQKLRWFLRTYAAASPELLKDHAFHTALQALIDQGHLQPREPGDKARYHFRLARPTA